MNLPEPDFHNGALVALAQLLLMSLEVAGNRLGEAQNVDPELLEQMNETYAACLEHLSEHRYVPAFFTVWQHTPESIQDRVTDYATAVCISRGGELADFVMKNR